LQGRKLQVLLLFKAELALLIKPNYPIIKLFVGTVRSVAFEPSKIAIRGNAKPFLAVNGGQRRGLRTRS
jgi:hypothetical protein